MRRYAQLRHGGHTLAVVGWVLGWTLLLAVGLGQAAERYSIVQQQSQLRFKGYSLLAKALGTFHRFSGEIVADAQQLSASRIRFVIEAASIDTANAKRDQHLRSKDFLFVDQYPTIIFTSTAITKDGMQYVIQGDLEMRGVIQRVTIPVTIEQRQDEIVVQGGTSLNRRNFGVQYNAFFNPVQDTVDVTFTIVGVKL
jgi:polyisoprenoid-binding protein YceI